jgi:RNA polymerase-binding transcription factor DksA
MPIDPRTASRLAAAIEARHRALVEEIRAGLARMRGGPYAEVAGATPDAGDQSLADLLADLGGAETSRDVRELRELEAARRRIAEGSYGVCTDCGGDVGEARLAAEPAAARCIDCQRRHERTYRD